MALLLATFFLASAGASSAYLTVSEIFPMETRALAIAFFYAIGTAVGGITGPLLFAKLIGSGDESQVAIGFYLGAGVMALGGVVAILFGVKAEQQELEDVAKPLTAEEAEREGAADEHPPAAVRTERRRRARLGPGSISSSPGMWVSTPTRVRLADEIERIERELTEHGAVDRQELARRVGARSWGPGCFAAALREAVESGRRAAARAQPLRPAPACRHGLARATVGLTAGARLVVVVCARGRTLDRAARPATRRQSRKRSGVRARA
jgi:hypothetical protein